MRHTYYRAWEEIWYLAEQLAHHLWFSRLYAFCYGKYCDNLNKRLRWQQDW